MSAAVAKRAAKDPCNLGVGGDGTLADAIEKACARIAPVWPLDRSIAVNPWWPLVDAPLPCRSAELAARCGATLVMPRNWFREAWQQGRIRAHHLEHAARESRSALSTEGLLAALERQPESAKLSLVSQVLDAARDLGHEMSWEDGIAHDISQFCASYFDRGQAAWRPPADEPLYAAWLHNVARNRGIGLLMGTPGLAAGFRDLPRRAADLLALAARELEIDDDQAADWLHALLLSVNGWASWCAWLRWQQGLHGGSDDSIVELLAIRAAWDVVLMRHAADARSRLAWDAAKRQWQALACHHLETQAPDWIWQRAAEVAFQQDLAARLAQPPARRSRALVPLAHAVFCIDVRSERFRRALEATSDRVRTSGFAGFFGLPIAHRRLGTDLVQPQLPGLLAAKFEVADVGIGEDDDTATAVAARRRFRLSASEVLRRARTSAGGGFPYVETAGLLYGLKLGKDALLGGAASEPFPGLADAEHRSLVPRLLCDVEGKEIDVATRTDLAAGALRGMSMGPDFAPLVALIGHGSRSANNPLAAALDCGACGGRSGDVNARVLAGLLNDPAVRQGLAQRGIEIPAATRFVAALHDTTTDEIALFEHDPGVDAPPGAIARLRGWLDAAGNLVRRERAPSLGIAESDRDSLLATMQARAVDWSQVRPEWGLAGNAAFIVGPRELTEGIDLAGRVFLHDYDWRTDHGHAVLELILTAPMVVTHWINMQYYASTVDPRRYGSGNKVLHNVVGGSVGVFEGNGGDLRTGLALQSVHDGSRWVHEPLRLSVIVAAPRDAIADVLHRHATVHNLVENEWLYLFQIDGESRRLARWKRGEWIPFDPGAGSEADAQRVASPSIDPSALQASRIEKNSGDPVPPP